MKKLYLYLLASALLSIVVLGWLIDTFNQQALSIEDEFVWQRSITGGFIKQLERQPENNRVEFAKLISVEFSLDVSYQNGESLALPAELKKEIFSEKGLLLEDEMGFYLLKSSYNMIIKQNKKNARKLLFATIIYYPILLIIFVLDQLTGINF